MLDSYDTFFSGLPVLLAYLTPADSGLLLRSLFKNLPEKLFIRRNIYVLVYCILANSKLEEKFTDILPVWLKYTLSYFQLSHM